MKCFYHAADADGHLSGWLVKKFNPDCEMIGVNYGDEILDVVPQGLIKRETIFVVDFSFSKDIMEGLNRDHNLIWIDHHTTSVEEMLDLQIKGFRNSEHAACTLTYMYCTNEAQGFPRRGLSQPFHGYMAVNPVVFEQVPMFIKYVSDYDAWRHEYKPDSTYFNRGLYAEVTDPSKHELERCVWYYLEEDPNIFERIVARGKIIYDYQIASAESKCKSIGYSRMVAFKDIRAERDSYREALFNCFIINQAHWGSLQYGTRMDNHDICMTYHWNGKLWIVSMRSEEVDVGSIAKANGGGGHERAAGFTCKELPAWIL